jgi:Domain of unknown function (DUF4258)
VAILEDVREAAKKRLFVLGSRYSADVPPERMITPGEVRTVVLSGDLIEDYPQDPRGHSCLLLGFGDNNRAVHVVCSPKDEYLAIITAYLPDSVQWSEDFRRRQ